MAETTNLDTTVSDVDPKKLSTRQLLAEYVDTKERLGSNKLAGWLCGRLEDRKVRLACTLADKMADAKGVKNE